jgi:hypothetical protein
MQFEIYLLINTVIQTLTGVGDLLTFVQQFMFEMAAKAFVTYLLYD